METKLLSEINGVLHEFPQYWEGDYLLKSKVIEDLREYNNELINSLLSNEIIKKAYNLKIDNGAIFKIDEFISMLRYKNYWDNSYTKFSNEIGLTSENRYLKYNTDVVLDFPYKDCFLEGGMTKEDIGKKEIYYHSILAKDEIDTMLSPKILANIKRYSSNGVETINSIDDRDNLLIKGNNLIALYTLKERFEKKVKLLYIVIHSRIKDSILSSYRNNICNILGDVG
ncbi:MAG: site-specific DNA-methyltransferase [Candidatus Paceibacterota bacterium]